MYILYVRAFVYTHYIHGVNVHLYIMRMYV